MKMRYIDGDPSSRFASHDRRMPAADAAWPFSTASTSGEPAAGHGDDRIAWGDYWHSVRKRRWAILAAALLATLGAAFFAFSLQPVYRSTATLLIESGKTKILSIEEVYNAVSQDREYYQTQVEILRSRDVAMRTVNAARLWNEPEFDPRIVHRSVSGTVREIINPPEAPRDWTPKSLADATVGKFQGAMSIEPVRLSQLVKISFEARDAELAATMANATANSFIEADRDARLKLNLSVTGLLQDRLLSLRERLAQSEAALQAYREKEGLVAQSGTQGVAGQQLSEIGQRLVAARVRRTELESQYQQVQSIDNGDYSSLPAVINQPTLNEARARVAAASMKVDENARILGEEHSRMIAARAELAAAQRNLQQQTRAIVTSLRREAQAARDTERALEAALAVARGQVQGVNRQEFQLGVLEREVQTNRQLYELFLSRTKETSVSTNLQAAVARVVDPASASTLPVRPNRKQIIAFALLLSLSAGALISVLYDRLRNTLQGTDEAEQRLRHPVLASLPAIRSTEATGLTRSFLDNPGSHHANAIRNARTGILLSKYDLAHKVVLITSTLSGEGKTTFCTNLAFAHAQNKRTLLIDCDLRNPQIGIRLGLPANAKGLANLIAGTAEMKECVHAVPGSSLLVMPAGELPGNPEDLLLSPHFRETLNSLANRMEIVLIDSPPVGRSSDALIIAQQVGNTIYVVKAHDTPHPMAQKGIARLRRAGASILGLVLNHMDEGKPGRAQAEADGFADSRQHSRQDETSGDAPDSAWVRA